MSIADFSKALKTKAYTDWLSQNSGLLFNTNTKELRAAESSGKFNDFLVTDESIRKVVERLSNKKIDQTAVNKIKESLRKAYGKHVDTRKAKGALFFQNFGFSQMAGAIDIIFKNIPDKVQVTDAKTKEIRDSVAQDAAHRGHVYGVLTKLTQRTLRSLYSKRFQGEGGAAAKQLLRLVLEDFEEYLIKEDLATSNLTTNSESLEVAKLYGRYEKDPGYYLVELQLADVNAEAGAQALKDSLAIRALFNPKNADKLEKVLTGENVTDATKRLVQFIETRGSPSYIDLVVDAALAPLEGRRPKKNTIRSPKVPMDAIRLKVPSSKVLKKTVAGDLRKVRTALAKLRAQQSAEITESITPISALTVFLNGLLAEQIKKNMGTGNRTDVLNYRTGRLANSARVNMLTVSRSGMISAFYTYQKDPYATFSEGGAMQYPRSRDPKLLISKSIRELMSSVAQNNFRAVLV